MVDRSNSRLALSNFDSKVLSLYGQIVALLLPIHAITLPGNTILLDWFNIALIPHITAFFLVVKSVKTNTKTYLALLLAFGLIVVSSLVATWFSPNPTDSLFAVIQEIYLFCWFLVLVFLFRNRRIVEAFLRVWVIVASFAAVLHLLQYFDVGPVNSALNFAEVSYGGSRSTGFYKNPNLAANYNMVSIFLLMISPLWHSRFRIFLLILLIGALLTTGSTGSLIALVIGGTISGWVFLQKQSSRTIILICATIITTTALLLADVPLLTQSIAGDWGQRLLDQTVGRYISTDGELVRSNERTRDVFWRKGIEQFYNNPLGIGPNSFKELHEISIHNDYLGFLIERGLLGFLSFLLFLTVVVSRLWILITYPFDSDTKWFAVVLFSAFVGVCFDSILHEVFHYRHYWVLLALIFSISSPMAQKDADQYARVYYIRDVNLRAAENRQPMSTMG